MELSLYKIYENLILEGTDISEDMIKDSIERPFRVKILYKGEDEDIPHERFIDPYLLGTLTSGNRAVRAYHSHGYAEHGEGGKWKTYLVKNILQWQPTKYHIGLKPIDAYTEIDPVTGKPKLDPNTGKLLIPLYRLEGLDKKFKDVTTFRKFGDFKRDEELEQWFADNNIKVGTGKGKIEPTTEPTTEPMAKPTTKPVATTVAKIKPATKPVTKGEPVAKIVPKAQPKAEPKAQPKVQPKAEPKVQPPVEPELPPTEEPEINVPPKKGTKINKKI